MSVRAFHYLNSLGLVISVLVAILIPSFRADEECFTRWGEHGFTQSLMHIYDRLETTNYTYPPLGVYICAAASEVRNLAGFPTSSVVWRFLLKLPAILAVFLGAYLVRSISCRLFPKYDANIAGLTYAFSPVLLIVGPVWGQWDALLVLGILCIIWAIVNGKFLLAGPAVATTILVKPQVILVLPVLGMAALITMGYRKFMLTIVTGLLVFLCFTAPFFIAGTGGAMLKSFGSSASACGRTTYYAPNLWAIYEHLDPHVRQHESIASAHGSFLGVTNCSTVGIILYAGFMIFVLWNILRLRTWESYIFGIFLSVFGAFCLLTGMHERYAVPAVMMLGLVRILSSKYRTIYSILTITTVMNLGYVYLLSQFEGLAFLSYLRLILAVTAPVNLAILMIVTKYLRAKAAGAAGNLSLPATGIL